MKTVNKLIIAGLLLASFVSAETIPTISPFKQTATSIQAINKNLEFVLGRGITVGNSTSTTAGTIRWSGTAFEGYNGSAWGALGGGSTDAELQYKNCTATPANGAAITFLNTVDANVNPFWQKDALEILPASYAVPSDAGAAVMRASTDQGIEVVMQKQYDINTMRTKFRMDVLYGVVNKQPEMSGIMLFSQT